jgi:hypothetical protein
MKTLGTNWAGSAIKRETALSGKRVTSKSTRAQRLEKIKKEIPRQLGLIWLMGRELKDETDRKEAKERRAKSRL